MSKRPTVYEIEQKAREKYPDESWQWHRRYAKMSSRIIGWEGKYEGFSDLMGCDAVLLLVEEEDHTTRSPAKRQAIQDWRDEGELVEEKPASPAQG